MDYSLSIWSIVVYIESNIKRDIKYSDLEKTSGFSYRHLRTIFKDVTGISLSKYILNRRVANVAFELKHTHKPITDIAYKYNFNSYDTFARAFKRITGISPKAFRSSNHNVGHRCLVTGFYAPDIYTLEKSFSHDPILRENINMKKEKVKRSNSCILLGVPKVSYSFEECTPLALSIKSALNYLGDKIDYGYILAASGAAFRLRWNKTYWDNSNIDVLHTYEDKYEILDHIFNAVNREYKLIRRSNSTKEAFQAFIVKEIDAGRPVIGFGIIGPPEACIITGYQNNGAKLLGWNCFQENKDIAGDIEFHQSGYFMTDKWWNNSSTVALISIGSKSQGYTSQKALIKNAIDLLSAHEIAIDDKIYSCGQHAYDLWAKSILDESQFNANDITPIKIEKLMCQGDAQAMVGEGRSYAAHFLKWIGNTNKELKKTCDEASKHFEATAACAIKMYDIRGGFQQSEKVLNQFMRQDIREKLAKEIENAKSHEFQALELLKQIHSKI